LVLTAVDWLGVSVVVRWLLGWWLSRHLLPLPRAHLEDKPSVSVLIPARNEEDTLSHLLQGLCTQTLQPLEVIVIDDHSSDRTPAIAREASKRFAVVVVAAAFASPRLVRQNLGPAQRGAGQFG